MQSTKGRAEHFVWLCRIDALGNRLSIQPFPYVEGSRFQTKRSAFRHAERARMRWQDNYAPYRDATMVLIDSAELEGRR